MSVYKDFANPTQTWAYSADITVDNSAGSAAATDVTITIPSDWDPFWETVATNGEDIRVCDADGQTLLTFDLNGFDKSTRAGLIEIDGYVMPAAKMCRLKLYWGNSSAASAKTTFVPSTPVSGYIELGGRVGPTVQTTSEAQGETRPRGKIAKASGETIFVTFDFDTELQRRAQPFNGSDRYEEIDYVDLIVYAANGTGDETTTYTANATRFVAPARVIVQIKGGQTATDYVAQLKAITTFRADGSRARTLVRRQQITVRDVTAS